MIEIIMKSKAILLLINIAIDQEPMDPEVIPYNSLVKMLMVTPVHGQEGVQPIRGDARGQLQLPRLLYDDDDDDCDYYFMIMIYDYI